MADKTHLLVVEDNGHDRALLQAHLSTASPLAYVPASHSYGA